MGGLRQLVRALRGGGLAAVLPDQVPVAGAGVVAPFFGHGAYTMALAGKLLARVDAEVVVATARRVPGGFSVRIDSVPAGIRDPDPAVSAAAMNRAAEDAVAAHPEQYQWEYKRYRFPGRPEHLSVNGTGEKYARRLGQRLTWKPRLGTFQPSI